MVPTSSEMIYGGQKSLSVVRDAIVTPTTVDKKRRTFTGCVYDSAGVVVRSSQRTAANVSWQPADSEHIDPASVRAEIDGACVYLGHYTAQYGHFLLETLSRFWVLETDVSYGHVLLQPSSARRVHARFRRRTFPLAASASTSAACH